MVVVGGGSWWLMAVGGGGGGGDSMVMSHTLALHLREGNPDTVPVMISTFFGSI